MINKIYKTMTLFDYTNKEYVNPVDLTVLNKVYDSLETSHNLALDTASATKQALAALPVNSNENEFISKLSNKVDDTISEFSRFGNAGYALDNIKKLSGDLVNNPVLRRKIQNNQAWMEFNKKIENMGLSQTTINRLKELNPYEDNGYINWETGEMVEGDEWKPKVDAASPVSRTDIYKTILNICAKQYGDVGTQFLYLDKDGNPVNTPEESGDKLPWMYKDGKYVQLSKEQLEKTYKLLLHDHPEIAASLRQEYDDFQWLYDKEKERNLAEGNDSIPFIPGFTDKNGLRPSFEDWVNTSVGQFADIASYTQFTGTYKPISNSSISLGGSSSSSSSSSSDTTGMDMLPYTTIELATTTVDVDPYDSAMSSYLSAYSTLCEFEPFSANFDTAGGDIVKFIDNIEKNGGFDKYISNIESNNKITSDDKKDILSALNCIKECRKMMIQIENSSKDPELYRYNEMASIDRYEANNKYGKEIIKKLNDFNLADGTITYTFKNGSLYKDLIGEYGVEDINDIDGLNVSKDKDGNYVVTFDSRNQNLLPKFNYIIYEAKNKNKPTGSWWQKTFKPNTIYDYNFLVNTTGNAKNSTRGYTMPGNVNYNMMNTTDRLYDVYNSYKDKATKLQKENNVSIQFPIKGFSYETFDEFVANDFVKSGRGTYEAGRKYAKDLRTALRDGMKKANFSNGSIQLRVDGEFKTIMKDTNEYDTLIKTMFTQYPKSCNISQIVNNVKDGKLQDGTKPSYYISMNVPDEKDNAKYNILKDKKFKGKHIELIVQGPVVNSTNYNPAYSPVLIAQNQVYIANQSSTDIQGLNYVYGFGDTSLKKNGDFKYSGTFCDKDITLTTQEACELYAADLLYAQALKSTYKIALNNGTEDEKNIANNSFNVLAESMSKNTGVNLDVVKDCLTKYLKQ